MLCFCRGGSMSSPMFASALACVSESLNALEFQHRLYSECKDRGGFDHQSLEFTELPSERVKIATHVHSHANAGPIERLAAKVYKFWGWHVWVKPLTSSREPAWIAEGECVNTGDTFTLADFPRPDYAFIAGLDEALTRYRKEQA